MAEGWNVPGGLCGRLFFLMLLSTCEPGITNDGLLVNSRKFLRSLKRMEFAQAEEAYAVWAAEQRGLGGDLFALTECGFF